MKFTNLLIGFFAVILSIGANAQSLFTKEEINQNLNQIELNLKNNVWDGSNINGVGYGNVIVNKIVNQNLTNKAGYVGSFSVERTILSWDSLGSTIYNPLAKKIEIHIFDNSIVSTDNFGTNIVTNDFAFKTLSYYTEFKQFNTSDPNSISENYIDGVKREEQNLQYNIIDGTSVNLTNTYYGASYGAVYFVDLPISPGTPISITQDCSNPDFTNTSNSSVCLIGQILEGCKLSSGNYYTSINSVAGNVGLTAVDLKITCSTGMPYHLKPIHEKIELAGTDEILRLTGWKDSGRGDKLTPLSAKVINGTGSEQSITIYFTLEGKGKSGLYGNSVVNKYNGSAVYPIQINY